MKLLIVEADSKRFAGSFEVESNDGMRRAVALFQANVAWIGNQLGKETAAILNKTLTQDKIENLLGNALVVSPAGSVVCAGICATTGGIRKTEQAFTYRSMWSFSNGKAEVLGDTTTW